MTTILQEPLTTETKALGLIDEVCALLDKHNISSQELRKRLPFGLGEEEDVSIITEINRWFSFKLSYVTVDTLSIRVSLNANHAREDWLKHLDLNIIPFMLEHIEEIPNE